MKEEFLQLLNKVINDELSANVFYKRAAFDLAGANTKNVSDELIEHANEESEHFDMLVEYASNYDILKLMNIALVPEDANFPIGTLENVITKVQKLEEIAINDYERLFMMSREMKDFTGVEVFKKILKDEIEHYDDLAYVLGQSRNLFLEEPVISDEVNSDSDEVISEEPSEVVYQPFKPLSSILT